MTAVSKTPAQLLSDQWAKRLTTARKAANISQTTLAEMVNRDQPWVSRYERGKGNWTIDTMILFAAALSTPVDQLFPFPSGIEAMERFRLGLVERAA